MAEATIFRGVIEFFGELGIYDVVLPFLLLLTVFVIFGAYAIYQKKTVKGIIFIALAYPITFLITAGLKLTAVINEALANILLLLIYVALGIILTVFVIKEKKEQKKVFFIIFLITTILLGLGFILTFLSLFY